MVSGLAKLEYVPIQSVWPDENADLTPWLASSDGLEALESVLGFKPIEPRTQVDVGSFRADIVASRPDTEDTVVFENQFGDSDHKHLGQILTYAAGLKAATVVWIAERIQEEHRQALRWLNENSKGLSFFGVELKAARIGGSDTAAFPVVVAAPSETTRKAAEALKPWLTKGRDWHLEGPEVWDENAVLMKSLGERLERDNLSLNWNLKLYVRIKGPSGHEIVVYDNLKKGRLDVLFVSANPKVLEALLSSLSVDFTVEPEHQYAEDPWVGIKSVGDIDRLYPAISGWLKYQPEPILTIPGSQAAA